MNRKQRRDAARSGRDFPSRLHEAGVEGSEAKPGLFLRLFANVVLTPWVLTRVKHADVERLLAGVAMQAGRPEVAKSLLNRIAMRKENPG